MEFKELLEQVEKITGADESAMTAARERQAKLAKPPGSLGLLEEISVRIAGMTGKVINNIDKGCVAVFCSDNGVVEEGVASSPQSVTMAQTVNFTKRLTGVGALAECFGSELLIVDMGVKDPIPGSLYDDVPLRDTHKIINRRVRPGSGETDSIAKGPAMSEEEALAAIGTGIEMAKAVRDAGFDICGIGEMGIGNTTTSAAVISALTGEDSSKTVGRGGGVNDAGFARKKEIVNAASEAYRSQGGAVSMVCTFIDRMRQNETGSGEGVSEREYRLSLGIRLLAETAGFDICAMTGAFLGAAICRIPVVIDGYISAAAAAAACFIAPKAADYMIASHRSYEPGYLLAADMIGAKPFLEMDMRLGEGSGCPIAFEIVKGACRVMKNMATFEEARINDDYLAEIRADERFQR